MSDTMRDRARKHVSRMTKHGLPTGPLTDTNGWLANILTAFAKAEVNKKLVQIETKIDDLYTDDEDGLKAAPFLDKAIAAIRTLKESTND